MKPRRAREEGNPHFIRKFTQSYFFSSLCRNAVLGHFPQFTGKAPGCHPTPLSLSLQTFKTSLRPPGRENSGVRHALAGLQLTLEHTPASCLHPRHLAAIPWVTNVLSQQDLLLETSSHCDTDLSKPNR